MAAKNTGKSTGAKKGTPVKKTSTQQKNTKAISDKKNYSSNAKGSKSKKQVQEEEIVPKREELVPEFSNEIILLLTLVVSVLLFLSNFSMSGKVGEVINGFTFGLFGVLAYVIPLFLFFTVAFYLANRSANKRYIPKLIAAVLLFAVFAAIVQLVFEQTAAEGLLEYYKMSAENKNGGGLLGGILCFLLVPAFGKVGTYVVLVAIALLCVMVLTGKALFAMIRELSGKEFEKRKEARKVRAEQEKEYYEQQELDFTESKAKSFLLKPEEEEELLPKEEKKVKNFFGGFSRTTPAGKTAKEPASMQSVPVLDGETEELLYGGTYHMSKENVETVNSIYEEEMKKKFDVTGSTPREIAPIRKDQPISDVSGTAKPVPQQPKVYENIPEPRGEEFEPSFSDQALSDRRRAEGGSREKTVFEQTPYGIGAEKKERVSGQKELTKEEKKANQASAADIAQIAVAAEEAKEEVVPQYQFPPLELLNRPERRQSGNSEEELRATADKLKSTLESFGVHVTINNYSRGPAVTRYEIQPEQGVKVSKITNLADDIKLNLAAADVRIEAPIPGKAAVGIEVPNKENTMVTLRELIEAPEFEGHSSNLAFTVGRDIGGQCIVADIAKMPHLLIAGATGSGKSVCINTIIMSILYKAHPDDVKLLMVDPKVVELSVYNGIPHLLIPVVTDPKKASAALNWAVAEMEERYAKFYELNARDLKGYNEKVEEVAKEGLSDTKYPRYPQLVIIVDELADLMMVASGDVENAICRLAQKARAAGIHLILATQRPSVNVITGLIKANVPSRIAFAVSSGIDSRTILDTVGAEKLLGKGDMLFYPSGYPKPVRIQGAFVSDREVTNVVEFLKRQNGGPALYSEEISTKITTAGTQETTQNTGGSAEDGRDEYFAEAGRFIIERDKASIGMLQREYKIGFNRAARIMDQLADAGVVGPEEGTKPRKILMTAEEYEAFISGT
ncbi:MAG: DNA translocase FtsK [Lachnospiraceae bacterium]|nr:DNA translocase FtsK [Lachnospiraceae bacterium]